MIRQLMTLEPGPPFSLAKTLRALGQFQVTQANRSVEGGKLIEAVLTSAGPVICELAACTAERPRLRLTIHADRELPEEAVREAGAALSRRLGLDDDLSTLYRAARADPVFGPVLKRCLGLRLIRTSTPFEAACWAVIQQRTPNGFAYQTMARLIDLLGERIDFRGRTYTLFPTPERLAYGARPALLAATNNTRKVDRLEPLGQAFSRLEPTFLSEAPYAELAAWLRRIPGVGAWSVDYILLRGLGRTERTPWNDTGLLEAISQVYTLGFQISRGSARELAERYGWLQGYWAHYLKVFSFGELRSY